MGKNPRTPTRRKVLIGTGVGLVASVTGSALQRSKHVEVPLRSETVAFLTPTERAIVAQGQTNQVVPGTRVFTDRPQTSVLVRAERKWLTACDEWTHHQDAHSSALQSAQLDLRVLTTALPATVAAWTPLWRFTWPRDASFAAVALGLLGHHEQAWQQIDFLARMPTASGGFEARYDPWKVRSPDDRTPQIDGSGWVLWAIATLAQNSPPPGAAVALARRSAQHLLKIVDPRIGLPPVSPDYWEISEHSLTLGTAAAVGMGLLNAARFLRASDPALARHCHRSGSQVLTSIHHVFGRNGYSRYADDDQPDAAITLLLPPFLPGTPDPDILKALGRAERMMARPAGGLAPGAGWKDDGISWTPETALFAQARAAVGQPDRAGAWLEWLAAHRTSAGSYPEKVLHDGSPAAVAPLAWTAALVIGAVHTLRGA